MSLLDLVIKNKELSADFMVLLSVDCHIKRNNFYNS